MKTLLHNALIVNEGEQYIGSLLIDRDRIAAIYRGEKMLEELPREVLGAEVRNCKSLLLLPGGIDDQVHFRDPGLTHKGDIETESSAAIAGGITSFMEMPNTKPPTTNYDALMGKLERAAAVSRANYGFFLGGTNDNAQEIFKIDPKLSAGIKLFLGSSTGNMLVDNEKALSEFFAESPKVIAIHSESEPLIQANKEYFVRQYGEDPPIVYHPLIRSEEACYRCTADALDRASKYGTKLHVLHLSTGRELALFDGTKPLEDKSVTCEACVHHLWFTDEDYASKGALIKWNPAIKTKNDRDALRKALTDGRIDIIATDHSPHLLREKEGGALKAASGGPLLQYVLLAVFELVKEGVLSLETMVQKVAHNPAIRFGVVGRGFLRTGYYADITLIDPAGETIVKRSEQILGKCGWSPFEGTTFQSKISATYLNGQLAYDNGELLEGRAARPLLFEK